MKFTLSWLKKHLLTDCSLVEITDKLTAIGLEVENIDDFSRYNPFLIGQIIGTKKHPEADKLQIVTLDIGGEAPIELVCGAPNAREGIKVVYAPSGTYIPGLDITLSVAKIRGVESRGMLCSMRELQLSDEDAGIIELPLDAPIGMKYADYAQLIDPVVEINVTPNRSDATSVYGIARDLAAAGLGTLKDLPQAELKASVETEEKFSVTDDCASCLSFAYRVIKGVNNKPSPDWLQKSLRSIGVNSFSSLVDVTNYYTFDLARPLHVFDAQKIKGNVVIRNAEEGEEFLALNGETYVLSAGDCVLSDDEGIISLAGIMGGLRTACDIDTKDVIVEAAIWDSKQIARTGRNLGLSTDARYRFERGVDPNLLLVGLDLACNMMVELCGGDLGDMKQLRADNIAGLSQRKVIDFPISEINRLLGIDIAENEAKNYLDKLGFAVETAGDIWQVTAPSWRHDIDGKADIVEEIMRLYGVDNIEPQVINFQASHSFQSGSKMNLSRCLASLGLMENVNYSFISEQHAKLFGGGDASLKLLNPISLDMSDMRPSLLPGLLINMQRNVDRGFSNLAFFEIGDIYLPEEKNMQTKVVTTVRQGKETLVGAERLWNNEAKKVSLYDAKMDAMSILSCLGMKLESVQVDVGAPSWYHPGRSGVLSLGKKNILGYFGELHPEAVEAMGLEGVVCACEIFLDRIPQSRSKGGKTKAELSLSNLQPLVRDFSFIVDKEKLAAELVRAAKAADKKLITEVKVFDVFEGGSLEDGKKAIGLEITIQPYDKSLTDADIEELSQKIINMVAKSTGAILRS